MKLNVGQAEFQTEMGPKCSENTGHLCAQGPGKNKGVSLVTWGGAP